MALLISGLKLPKKGRYSTVTIYWDGRVVFKFGGAEAGQAIEIPPHGRLIDEKVVLDHFVGLSNNEWNQRVCTSWADAFAEAASDICDIPTVIEAEEDRHDY